MKIDFYTDNEAKAATVENYLFSDDYALIMVGQKIEYNNDLFQVNMLENDENGQLKNVFVWKYPLKDN